MSVVRSKRWRSQRVSAPLATHLHMSRDCIDDESAGVSQEFLNNCSDLNGPGTSNR